ncbi:MAG TPA: arylesterase [Hyphomicrobium sp.]|nr:arylesterase [Hyphomicrobium sp.]HET6388771.1 arylesterase [Hyphomicrobium sp.]
MNVELSRARDWFAKAVLCLTMAFVYMAPPHTIGSAAAETRPATILAFGDSLTAGYGLKADESFPAQLQMALQAKGHKVNIINAGVSGDTTSGGLARLDWTLEPKPDAVILELGANDALRGVDPKVPRANLDKMLASLKEKGIPVLLAGARAPNNWGPDYARDFDAIFPDLAAKYGVPLYPFFLEGVALDRSYTQSDGLHPTSAGVAEVVKRILPHVETLVQSVEHKQQSGN